MGRLYFYNGGLPMIESLKQDKVKHGNSKAGISIRMEQEEKEPFEVTVFFKKPETGEQAEDAISITASGKLSLAIGKKGHVELFGENTKIVHQLNQKEDNDVHNPLPFVRENDLEECPEM
jgi:hypothetical protein